MLALWAERSLAHQRHATGICVAWWWHATHVPRRATLVSAVCLWHANLVPRPAPFRDGRGAHLACPWPVTHFYSTTTVCYCNASYTQTQTPMSPKAKLLLFPTGWLLAGTNSKIKVHLPLFISFTLITDHLDRFPLLESPIHEQVISNESWGNNSHWHHRVN